MSDEWFYDVNGQASAPVTKAMLGQLLSSGQINRQTQVIREGIQWTLLGDVPELRDICGGGAAGGGQAAAPPPRQGRPCRVLIVDDSALMRNLLEHMLTNNGFEIAEKAMNARFALDKYKRMQADIDVVLMDIEMPLMDGVTGVQEFLKFDPNARIIMLSVNERRDGDKVKQCLLMGAKSYIKKPSGSADEDIHVVEKTVCDRILQVMSL